MFLWKRYKNSIFSRAQLLGITDSKTTFEGPFPKWHFCDQKCHFGFSPVPAETPIVVVFGDFEWAQEKGHFPKTDSCNENARFFNLPNTNSVCQFFKNAISAKTSFCSQPPKKHYFLFFFEISVSMFFIFFFFFLQHKKNKKIKSAHSFSKPLFDTPTNCPKNVFAPLHTICVFF